VLVLVRCSRLAICRLRRHLCAHRALAFCCSKIGLLALALFAAASSAAVNLGAADPYAIIAYSTITSGGPSSVIGNMGLSPGTSIVGFGPATCSGDSQAGTTASASAHADANTAYTALKGMPCNNTLTNAELGGLTLAPVRCFALACSCLCSWLQRLLVAAKRTGSLWSVVLMSYRRALIAGLRPTSA
jgi:hypothetical protein